MQVCNLPAAVRTLIFDIDSTLYTNAEYAHEQVDVQIRRYADERGIEHDKARRFIADWRAVWSAGHGGRIISLGNTMRELGVPIEESIRWRRELLEPARFLCADSRLHETLSLLKTKYMLTCVTNNPVLPAKKTLEALGVAPLITHVVGLDTCGVSKPAEEPFRLICSLTKTDPRFCISIGDRYDLDIAPPLKMGMGGILVDGVEDVYGLPSFL